MDPQQKVEKAVVASPFHGGKPMKLLRNIHRSVFLGTFCLLTIACGGGGGGGGNSSADVTIIGGTVLDDTNTSLNTNNNLSGDTVYFDVVANAISSVRISNGCVYFVGDSADKNNISSAFCENDNSLPGNIANSAQGLRVSDGECPIVVAYENINYSGLSETIDFCQIERFAISCASCN